MAKRVSTVGSSARKSRSISARRLRTSMKRLRSSRENNVWLLLSDTIKMMRRISRRILARSMNTLREIGKQADCISLSILTKPTIFLRVFARELLTWSTCNPKRRNHTSPVIFSTIPYI